jgi:hypothetical protein
LKQTGEVINVVAPMIASVWKILVAVGDVVTAGQTLAILEAMKMEIRECMIWSVHGRGAIECTDQHLPAVRAEDSMVGSKVSRIMGKPGSLMDPGQVILALKA